MIELLVVVAIMVILAVLGFSGLKSMIAASDSVRCVSNLKVVGQQSLVFFGERNGNLFPVWDWMVHEPFLDLLGIQPPYTGPGSEHDTVLTCPAFKKKYPHIFPYPLNRCYSINRWAHQYDVQSMQGLGMNVPIRPGNVVNIKEPSAMWMFMDGAHADWGVFTYYGINMESYMGLPHAKGTQANAVFFDGHVAPVTVEMMGQYYEGPFWGGFPD